MFLAFFQFLESMLFIYIVVLQYFIFHISIYIYILYCYGYIAKICFVTILDTIFVPQIYLLFKSYVIRT